MSKPCKLALLRLSGSWATSFNYSILCALLKLMTKNQAMAVHHQFFMSCKAFWGQKEFQKSIKDFLFDNLRTSKDAF